MRKRGAIPEFDDTATPGQTPFKGDRQFVVALWRGLEILRAFHPRDEGLTNLELAQRTGLGASTVSRLSYTLVRSGYLKYDQRDGRYRLGVAVLGLGFACLAGLGIRSIAQPYMQELADTLGNGHLVALTTRDGLSMTYLACAQCDGVVSLTLDVGARISLAQSAAGRAYLAHCPADERDSVLTAVRTETPEGERDQLEADIRAGIAHVRTSGYCLNLGEWRPEVNAAAVPLPPQGNDPTIYTLNCGGPAYLLSPEKLEAEIAPQLREAAQRITAARRS